MDCSFFPTSTASRVLFLLPACLCRVSTSYDSCFIRLLASARLVGSTFGMLSSRYHFVRDVLIWQGAHGLSFSVGNVLVWPFHGHSCLMMPFPRLAVLSKYVSISCPSLALDYLLYLSSHRLPSWCVFAISSRRVVSLVGYLPPRRLCASAIRCIFNPLPAAYLLGCACLSTSSIPLPFCLCHLLSPQTCLFSVIAICVVKVPSCHALLPLSLVYAPPLLVSCPLEYCLPACDIVRIGPYLCLVSLCTTLRIPLSL